MPRGCSMKWEDKNFYKNILIWLIPLAALMYVYVPHGICMQSGWGALIGYQIIEGLVPYKDFFYNVPPLTLGLDILIYKLFGYYFLPVLVLGTTVRLLCFYFFYKLLCNIFSSFHSACGTLLAGIGMISWPPDSGGLSWQDMGFLCGYIAPLLFIAAYKNLNNKYFEIYIFFMGVVCGISFLNKQTYSLATLAAMLILLSVLSIKLLSIPYLIKNLALVGVGIFSTFIIPIVILWYNDALISCINNIFGGAIDAKLGSDGHVMDILWHSMRAIGHAKYMRNLFIVIMVCIFTFTLKKYNLLKLKHVSSQSFSFSLFIVFICILIIFSAYIYVLNINQNYMDIIYYAQFRFDKFSVVAQFFIIVLAWYFFCDLLLCDHITQKKIQYAAVFSGIYALGFGISMSMSPPYFSFFQWGLIFSWLMGFCMPFGIFKNIAGYIFLSFCLFWCAAEKIASPCIWNSWQSQPVTSELATSSLPVLFGLTLPRAEVEAFEEIASIVNQYTEPEDRIFVYNNIQAFYSLVNRRPLTNNISHFWDVCPDELAIEDADLLKSNPPKIIIYMQYGEGSVAFQEYLYRSGKESGQRMIDKTILEFMKEGKFYAKKIYYNKNTSILDHIMQPYFDFKHAEYTQLDAVLPTYFLYVLVRADLIEEPYEENFYRYRMPE